MVYGLVGSGVGTLGQRTPPPPLVEAAAGVEEAQGVRPIVVTAGVRNFTPKNFAPFSKCTLFEMCAPFSKCTPFAPFSKNVHPFPLLHFAEMMLLRLHSESDED